MKIKTSLCAGAALGVFALAIAGGAAAQDTTTAWKGAPQWTNDDVQFKVRGRILLDYVYQDVDRAAPLADYKTSNARGRQVFLGVEGKLNNYLAYKAEGGSWNGAAWAWDDVVIEFKPNDYTSLMVGNIKAAGLENMTSTRFISFLDRGPYGDIAVDSYLLSVVGKVNGQNWTVTGQVAGDSLNNADVDNTSGANPGSKERVGFTARATYAPINGDVDKLHLGVWARTRNHGDEAAFNYRGRTNTNYGNTRYYSTGAIGEARLRRREVDRPDHRLRRRLSAWSVLGAGRIRPHQDRPPEDGSARRRPHRQRRLRLRQLVADRRAAQLRPGQG